MKVAVLIASRNRPDRVRAQVEWLRRNSTLDHDLYVVEAGTDDAELCEHSTIRYVDDDFRGETFAFNVALERAREAAREGGFTYDYHWVLTNDVAFEDGVDAMRILVDRMEAEPRIGVLSPTCENHGDPGSVRRPGGGWRAVTTCADLGFMVRGEVVEAIGFLNPDFRYGWGAIDELSFLLHSHGYGVAYSDDVACRHLGGATYGVEGTGTISREEHQRRARRFAFTYFNRVYGADWARVFADRAAPFQPETDTYSAHEADWMSAFTPDEAALLKGAATVAPAAGTTPDGQPAQMTKVLAWPRYDDAAALEHFFEVFGRVLEGREDVVLFLRVDPECDPSQDDVIAALASAHANTLGEEALLNVNLLQGPVTDAEWREMGPLLACRIHTADESAPRDAARLVPTPIADDAASLHAILADVHAGAPLEPNATSERPGDHVMVPTGQPSAVALAEEIAALQP